MLPASGRIILFAQQNSSSPPRKSCSGKQIKLSDTEKLLFFLHFPLFFRLKIELIDTFIK
jgi:hypothetical protein